MIDAEKKSDNAAHATTPPETIYVKSQRISCDGGGGALGHPKVWYSLIDGEAVCGYCGRHFIFAPEKAG
ncbi:MAG: zinc-finger domain-containing protein [Pseudomonadota bacterium]